MPPRRHSSDDDDDASVSEPNSSPEPSVSRRAAVESNPFAAAFMRKPAAKPAEIKPAAASTPKSSSASSNPFASAAPASKRPTVQADSSEEEDADDDEADEPPSEEEDEDDEPEDDEENETEAEEEYADSAADAAAAKRYRQPKLQFDLDTFSGDSFDAGSFVSDLTRELFEQQSADDFDPAPFALLFDSALLRLNQLRDETDDRIVQYAAQCRRDEEQHKEGLTMLQEQLGAVHAQFRRLDSRIGAVAQTAVRIGHTLQSVDQAKRHNLAGQELIAHFLAFNSGQADKLPAIYSTTNTTELHRAAALIQTLSHITQDLRVKGTEKASELIAHTSNEIEKTLIASFDLARDRGNTLEMKECAATLLDFRGRSIVKRYVFQVIEAMDAAVSGSSSSPTAEERALAVADNDKSLVGQFRAKLARFYRAVGAMVQEQVALVSAVFAQPALILRAILERVFQDKIQGLVDAGLGDKRMTEEEYLRALEASHAATLDLVQSVQGALRSLGHANGTQSRPSSIIGLGGASSALSSSSAPSSSPGGEVSMMNLSDQVLGIFSSYRASYYAREVNLLRVTCYKTIHDVLGLQAPHSVDPAVDETDFLGRVKKEVLHDQKQKWVLMVLEYPVVDKLLGASTGAVLRADKLSLGDPAQVAEDVSGLFLHLASALLEQYIQPILDAALESLPPPEPKSDPDPFFFQSVGLINLVADKLQLHYTHFISPRLAVAPNTQVVTDARLRELLHAVEQQLCSALARCLSSHIKYVARLLSSKQKNSDYKPRDDDSDALLDGKPSAACESVCTFVKSQLSAIQTCLDGKNLDKFLTILGLKLHDVLVVHLQKLSVSTMGAGLLARDMKAYIVLISSLHIPAVLDRWIELRQIVDLFYVAPEHLKSVITDSSKLSRLDQPYLLSWIQMRADYSDQKRKIHTALNLREQAPEIGAERRKTTLDER